MDVYNLINSKAISEHCRKIEHKFNTEELAVLIYRNKKMSIKEKITAYKELIEKYPDMEVIERINCKHYDSVKDMIKGEIERVEKLIKILETNEEDVVYSYNYYCECYNRIIEGKNEYRDIYKTIGEVKKLIEKDIKEDDANEIKSFSITKRTVSRKDKYRIKAEYALDEGKTLKMVNIYDFEGGWLDISNICLNIPTPFKKGDLLISNSKTPFGEGHILNYDKFPFVLEHLVTWNENFQKLLNEGNHDSSDMQGPGYLVSEDDGEVYYDNVFDYDSWDYLEGELEGSQRILKGVSNLMQDKIGIELFLKAYDYIRAERNYLDIFTPEGLELAGLNKEDIDKINKL